MDTESSTSKKRSEKELVDRYWKRGTIVDTPKQIKKAEVLEPPSLIEQIMAFTMKIPNVSGRFFWATVDILSKPASIRPMLSSGWRHFKDDLKDYWAGTKVLGRDVATCVRLLRKITKGKSLSRRGHRQLKRTTIDLFRLVPFAAFVVIPFMELLLPVALKLFPGMLPSTFRSEKSESEKKKRELQARLAYAEFLQETTEEMAASIKHGEKQDVATLREVIQEAKEGKRIPNKTIISLAKFFEDEMMLENLPRSKLVIMCKYMNISFTNGPTDYLRFAIRNRIRDLKRDDKVIMREGVQALTMEELRTANRDRGMRCFGLTKLGYERNLQQWLDLSVNPDVPISLLVLSRAFAISETRPVAAENVMTVIQTLDEDTINEVAIDLGLEDNVKKIEIMDKLNEKIRAEDIEDEKRTKERDEKTKLKDEKTKQVLQERIDKDLGAVAQEITDWAATSAVERERKTLQKIKKQAKESREEAELDLLEIDETLAEAPETKRATQRRDLSYMERRMESMLSALGEKLDKADAEIGDQLNLIDRDHDGLVSIDELEMVLKQKQVFNTDEEIALVMASLKKLCKRKSVRWFHLDDVREIAERMEDTTSDEDVVCDDAEENEESSQRLHERKEDAKDAKNYARIVVDNEEVVFQEVRLGENVVALKDKRYIGATNDSKKTCTD